VTDSTAIPLVVGLDPSLTSTGMAVVSEGNLATRALSSKGKAADSLYTRHERLADLAGRIGVEVWDFAPQLVVIEAPAFSRLNGHQHDRSGLWWLVVHRLRQDGVPVLEVPPNVRAKYATGKGNAGKDEVVIAVTRRYPGIEFKTNDEADALVLACIGARLLGHPVEDSLPASHLESLRSLSLPEERHDQA
jgi:crossover junction endodeoxyribonuclease RuvC